MPHRHHQHHLHFTNPFHHHTEQVEVAVTQEIESVAMADTEFSDIPSDAQMESSTDTDQEAIQKADQLQGSYKPSPVASTSTKLGTSPIAPKDNDSHAVVYRYPLPLADETNGLYDLTQAIPRESVLDFFYPHVLESDGSTKSTEDLNWLKQRRDVFLLAFQAVQGLDADDRWSFYQIAGIHGLPHAPYDGDDSDWDKYNPEWWGGYCQHGSPLFPTWHRPYMLLLEQSIIRQAKVLAETLTQADEKAAVLDIADKLRFPYWDWASNSTRILGLPDVFISTDINLLYTWKSFSQTKIPNPLKAFVLPRDVGKPISSSDVYNPSARPNYQVPSQGTPFIPTGFPTVRHVTPTYLSNNDKLNVTLMRSAGTTLIEGVHAMLHHSDWLPFSNHFWSEASHGDGSTFGHFSSLELVHDFVHGVLGGSGGQMGYPEVAAFDPIFFFHHANVDRLTALWQYCYPNSWIPEPKIQLNHDGTYTLYPDSEANSRTELTPFRYSNEEKKFVISDDVRLVDADCGYTYPEILRARKENWEPEKMLEYLLTTYKPPQDYTNRWVLVLERIEKRAFNGPFSIRVFLGKPDADADTPINSPNFAGEIRVFARSTAVRCANCEQKKMMRAALDLTKTMVRVGITTAESLNTLTDQNAGSGTAPGNPLREAGSVTLVYVDITGGQLNPSSVPNWDGAAASLFYQEGVTKQNIVEFKYSITPTVATPAK